MMHDDGIIDLILIEQTFVKSMSKSISVVPGKPIADIVDRVARASHRTSAARSLVFRRARRHRRYRGIAATNESERTGSFP